MKHNAKKILAMLLSFVLVLSLLPGMTAFAASGNCGDNGDNVTWSYSDTTNTLTISGSGAMANNAYEIWLDNGFIDSIKTVVIENGVTSIGMVAFVDCENLTSITIPDSVTSIGMVAFANCASLTSITIPDSVTSIGSSAFYNCASLTSITIPNSVTSIGDGVFTGCDSLSSVTIPNSVTSIGYSMFAYCASLTSITIPNSVTSIGENAFYNCSSLTSITIPNSVTSISGNAFDNCSSLTSITIPNSVTSIGEYAFYDCSSLTSVTFEPGTTGAQLKFDHDAFEAGPLLAYGAGSARLYDGDTEIKAGTALNTLNGKTLTWNSTGYTVTVADTSNGTVTADKTTAAANDTITLTITPASGYQVQAITVTDENNNPVTVTNNSFTMPAANVTVKVTFIAESVQPTTYTVTYDANGGSGTMPSWSGDAGTEITIDTCSFTPPEGKEFDKWLCVERNTTYNPGQKITVDQNLTLTAQWKDEKKPDGGEKKTSGGGSGFDLVFNIPGEDNSWGYGGGYAPQQAYRVSLAPMQGGSAALGLTTGESGTVLNVYPTTTVYVFPNAEQGYVLDKIVWSLIDGSASYDITEAKNFVMPAMDVVVYVTFKPVG